MGFRIIYHPPSCPQCGSADITTEDIQTADGASETAYVCGDCHAAWPLACISDIPDPAPGRS